MATVYNYKTLNVDNLLHGRPIKNERKGKRYYSSVSYREEGKSRAREVYIQTPKMKLASDLCISSDGSRGYVDVEFSEGTAEFYKFMMDMDEHNIQKTHSNSVNWFNTEEIMPIDLIEDRYRSSIRPSRTHGGASLTRVYFQLDGSNLECGVYNEHKIKVDQTVIRKGLVCIMILRLDGLWIAKDQVGCDWMVEQIKVYTGESKPSKFNKFLIEESDDEDSQQEEEDEVDLVVYDDLEGVTLKDELIIE